MQRHHGLTGARTARETERAVVDGALHQPALGGMQERAPLLEIAQLTRLEQVSTICAAPTLKDTRIRKVVGAMKVDTRVPLDDEVLRRVDDLARSLGHTREEVIEETLRRSVAARSIRAIVERSTAASELTEDEAIRIA